MNPRHCYSGTNSAQTAKMLPEQRHKGGRLFSTKKKQTKQKNDGWHRVQRTKSIFLFYFYMSNWDIFSLVSCFDRCFLVDERRLFVVCFVTTAETYMPVAMCLSFSLLIPPILFHLHFLSIPPLLSLSLSRFSSSSLVDGGVLFLSPVSGISQILNLQLKSSSINVLVYNFLIFMKSPQHMAFRVRYFEIIHTGQFYSF